MAPGDLGIYWRMLVVSIKSQMQYKVSFLLAAFGECIITATEIAGIWALFTRFGALEHWNIAQVCMFYGLVNVSFAIADSIATGFDRFGALYVKTGHFDRLLLRPRSIFVQLLGHELALRRIGRLTQGLIVTSWAIYSLELAVDPFRVLMMVLTIAASVSFFLGLFVIQATISFWSIESLEIMNTLTYGGVESSQYPMAIYEPWFRKFFTFVIPLACVSYFPVVAILGIEDPLGTGRAFQVVAPMFGVVFLGVSVAIFQFVGVRHYKSTGS